MSHEEGEMTIRKAASLIGAATVILAAVFTIDQRYVHAEELKKQMLSVKDEIASLHRTRIEDEMFKIELIPPSKRTDADKAMLDRYKRQLKEIDARLWRTHER